MITPETLDLLVNAGVAVILAVFAIYVLDRSRRDQIRDEKERTSEARAITVQTRDDKIMLLDVLRENIIVQQHLTVAINELRNDLRRRGDLEEQRKVT